MTKKKYDVIVVGAGHAGIEAALAASRLGCSTLTVTTSIESIGLMPCNPAIGGPAKGQIVGEIDALGGEMGIAADKTYIQMKVLNRSRGPAVQCLRSQNDKDDYAAHMQKVLCNSNNLTILEDMVTGLIIENDQIKGIQTQSGQKISSETVVVTKIGRAHV